MAKIITNGNKGGHIDGTGKSDVIEGKGGADRIGGHGGDDKIDGGDGNDHVHGGKGHDTLTGGSGKDLFVFKEFESTDSDKVTDFKHGTDRIGIDGTYLTAFSEGTFSDDQFVLGAAAVDSNDHLIYDQSTGKLYYDADGAGGEDQHLLATFAHKPMIDANDFQIFLDM